MTTYTFSYHRDAWMGVSEGYPEADLTMSVGEGADLADLLEEFTRFLSAAGFIVDPSEHLEFVGSDE